MQSENICRLCLLSDNNIIKFSSEEGLNLQITNIVSQHFWFKIQQNDGLPHAVCRLCWSNTKEFHEFYNSVEITHKRFNRTALCTGEDFKSEDCTIKSDDNSVEQNYNSIAETINQQNKNNALDDSVDLVKLEVVEDTINDVNFYDENDDRFEIFNQPKFNLIKKEEAIQDGKTLVSNKKSINLKKKTNKIVKKKIKIKSKTKAIVKKRKNTASLKKEAETEDETEELEEKIQESTENILLKIDKTDCDEDGNYLNNNNNNNNHNYNNNSNNIYDDGDDSGSVIDNDVAEQDYEQHLIKKSRHEPEILIAEESKKTVATQKRVAEDIKIREFFNLNCQLCPVTQLTFTEVKSHYRIVHNIKRGYVLCCKKKLFRRGGLLEHMYWHLNPDEFRCSICNKLYSDRYGLKLHMNFHISPENRNFSCDICGKRFSLKYHLKQHFTLTHIANQNRIYKCNECNKCFGLNSVLQSHIRGVHQFKNAHICHICAKVFKSKLQCDVHSSEHFNIEKVQCQICGSFLKNEHSLKSHVRRSHQEQPIECKFCGKISPNKEALRSHMKYVHEALRLHKCNFCDKAFKKPLNLREHIAGHTGSVLYTCPYCPKTFNSNANMHSHRKKAHLIEWQDERNKRKGISKF